MSSDSSGLSKNDGAKKLKPIPKSRKLHRSDESDDTRPSRASKESQNSVNSTAQPKITVLEQLGNKSSVAVDLYHNEEPHKGTATTHHSTAPTVITAVLRDLRDDIIRSSDYRHPGPVALVNRDRAIAVIGADNIYVQSKNKFIPVPREKVLSTHPDHHFWDHHASKLENHTPLDVAVLVQKVFTPISSMCFGLLGGVALLQLILVHHLVGGVKDEDRRFFLESYSRFAELTPLLFYVLLAVCIISVLDRVPVERETFCQPSWIMVAVYALTLVLTLSCASYDDMLTVYPHNKTMFQDQMKTQEQLSEWQLLNTLRCLFAMLGWVIFSVSSPPDMLLQHLLHVKQYEHKKQPSATPIRNSLH